MPLPVTEDTPPDMLAGAMDITVLLPSGRTVNMSVERSTPMMDLLVQLTTVHKLSLAGHTTVALSDSGYPLHHLPSTPLGALDTRLIQVAQRTNTLKKAPPRPNNAQPFTTTFRLQVHLPRNQLFVTRVSPDTKLSDILQLACTEKNLDPAKYELRHPANLCECLSPSHTLADYRLQEVTLVASRPPGTPLTPADIMALQREEEKRRQQVKKTGGIYNIIFNKRSKNTPEGSGSVSSDSLNGRSISPARSDESMERSVSPPAPAPPQRPGRKRRPAPKPPVSTPASVQNKETGVDNNKEGSTTLSHSRTSSDSSGYHEASVLSESPDTRTNSSAETLPRRSKLPSTSNIVAKNKCSTLQHETSKTGNHNLSRSLSNLTAVGINAQNKHSASTLSLASQGMSRKKKVAPPPPAVAPVKMADSQEPVKEENTRPKEVSKPTEIVAALLHDIKTFDEKAVVSNQDDSSENKIAPKLDKNLIKPVQAVPKLDDILDEEDVVLDLTTTKRSSLTKLKSVEQSSIESMASSVDDSSASVDSCRVDKPAPPAASPDLVTSAIIHTPPPAVQELELTEARPKPKPRVVDRPQPRPRQRLPPSNKSVELQPAATLNEVVEVKDRGAIPRVVKAEVKQKQFPFASNDSMDNKPAACGSLGRSFGNKHGKHTLSNPPSVRSLSPQSSNPIKFLDNTNQVSGDFAVLNVGNELEMFRMHEDNNAFEYNPHLITDCEETSNFSDLDFESSSLSSSIITLDKINLANYVSELTDKHTDNDLPSRDENTEHSDIKSHTSKFDSSVDRLKDVNDLESLPSVDKRKQNPGQVEEFVINEDSLENTTRSSMTSVSALQNADVVYGSVVSSPMDWSSKGNVGSVSSSNDPNLIVGGSGSMGRWPPVDDLIPTNLSYDRHDEDEDDVLENGIPPTLEAVLTDDKLGGASTPEMEEVPDWQYHLPAPPSAFRDLHSPTTTEFGTVVLADANVFQEASSENKSKNVQDGKRPTTDIIKPTKSIDTNTNVTDNVSVDDESTTSLLNGHTSLSSQSSLDSNEESTKSRCDVVNRTFVSPETDWEPQTMSIAENIKRTKPVVINGDLRLRQDGIKEVFKVNPIFNNETFEEDLQKKDQSSSTKVQSEENENYRIKNSINRRSTSDLQLSSQLKNFTISTYNKPQPVDNLFVGDQTSESDSVFKKPLVPSAFLPVTRTNSYSTMDKDRPAASVKRSTSHISLARPYTKPSTFQSISRTKSISSLMKEDDTDSSKLRKSTSDANINRLDDVPLQSLQVLKSILPRLSQSQILSETECQSQETSKSLATNQVTQANPEVEKSAPQPPADVQMKLIETSPPPPAPETKAVEVPKSEPRPFVYRGPPAINFSTWSERPKVQVSLKSDRDYRMGNQPSLTNVNTSQSNAQQTSKETSNTNKTNNTISNSVTASVSKVMSQNKPVVKNTEELSKKIEPTPLTMRIISHTTSSPRNKTSLNEDSDQNIIVSKSEKTTKVDFQQVDRLPIVRAVELKKTRPESFVQLRNSSMTHLNGSSNNVARVPVSYNQSNYYNRQSYIETGQTLTNGSPSLTKSVSTSQINNEPLENSFSQTKILANGGKKYTSVIGINGPSMESEKVIQNSGSVHKLQAASQVPRTQSVRQNFSTVKVNGFGGGKPMPIVKGFRMAGTEAANYDRGPVKISIEAEKPDIVPNKHTSKTNITNGVHMDSKSIKQPLKTINGIENMRTKSSLSSNMYGPKVQRNSSVILDQTDGKFASNIPEPPKPPTMVFKKPTQRPVSAFSNPRDELMHAIKNFGGRESLKPGKPKPNTNVILTI